MNLSGQTVRLMLKYRTPSLNQTQRQHWSEQQREKKRAWAALSSALQATASDPLIPITLQGALKDSWTVLDMHVSLAEMNRGVSGSKPSKSKSTTSRTSGPTSS